MKTIRKLLLELLVTNWSHSALLSLAVLTTAPAPLLAAAPASTALDAFSGPLQAPARLATDAAGNHYVTEPAAGRVVIFDAFGRVAAIRQGFARPVAIAVDGSGTIYLSEEKTRSVSAFDSQWNFLHKLGSGDGEFSMPNHLCVDPAPGSNTVYVCDGRANQIKAYQDGAMTVSFGSYGQENGQFDFPAGVYVSVAGEVFVVDQNNDRVQVFDRGGNFQRAFKLGGGGMGLGGISGRSQGITGDSQGRIYVADTFQGIVRVFTAQGASLSTIGSFGVSLGQLRSPVGLAIDGFNRLCVVSANNSRVELIGLDNFSHVSALPARQMVAAGSEVVFMASAGGTGPFTYRWRRDGSPLSDGGSISGAATASLTVAGAATNDTGSYSVEVTGPAGPVLSPAAALAVLTPPALVAQPTNITVLPGTTLILAVAASGDALGYQWQLNATDISGATSNTLELSNLQLADTGRYSVLVTNAVGSLSTDPAFVTVRNPPYAPTINSVSFLPYGRVQLQVSAEPDCPFTVLSASGMSGWDPVTSVFNQTGTLEFTDLPPAGNRFYRLVWLGW